MIYDEITSIARDRVQIEIGEQSAQIRQEIERIKREMAARGKLKSGAAVKRVADLCSEAIKVRAQVAWQAYFRFYTTAGVSYSETLADELKSRVAEHLPEQLGEIKDYIKQLVELIGMPQLLDHVAPELDAARRIALAKVGTEIDLFVHSLKRKQQVGETLDASTVFNIYSPVGSIQTGNFSVANVSQTIDTEVKARLLGALSQISEQLASDEISLSQPKKEVVELVEDSRREIEKSGPNMVKLRSMLSAIGSSIQTIASMAPAYEALKQALVFVSVSLP